MILHKIKVAKREAFRFVEKVIALEKYLENTGVQFEDMDNLTGTKQSGAVRRSSLDLTRALSDLRKNPYA